MKLVVSHGRRTQFFLVWIHVLFFQLGRAIQVRIYVTFGSHIYELIIKVENVVPNNTIRASLLRKLPRPTIQDIRFMLT